MAEIIVWLLLIHDNKILLLKKPASAGYEYTLIGGHVEPMEPLKQALRREIKEETGIDIERSDLNLVTVLDGKLENSQKLHFFFKASVWQGKPVNLEPHKHLDLEWYSLNSLPKELGPLASRVIASLSNKTNFSEYGWEESDSLIDNR
jgi:8-oxo-dGTP diphosphatase